MLTWIILKLVRAKFRDIHPILYVVNALFVIRIVVLILQATGVI